MENPRPEKVAKVAELEKLFEGTDTVVLTEYRGLDVPALADLRRELREAGGEYKIYKNTLVRFAARTAGLDLDELLTGPTAIAFVGERPDGSPGDPAAAAKVLRDFAKRNDALVVKGGIVDGAPMTVAQLVALADLPSRDVLLAKLAGGLAAPLQQFASLLQAMPRNLAFGLQALIDSKPPAAAPAADTPETAAPETDAETPESTDETPAAEAGSEQES